MEQGLFLHRGWFLEQYLVGIRWWMVPLCVIALPLFKPALWPLWLFHLLVFGTGNAWLAHVLRRQPALNHLRTVRSVATGLEWFTTLGALVLTSPDAATAAPFAMVVLLPVVAFRYGMRALIIAGTTTGAVVLLLVSAQIWLLHTLRLIAAWRVIEKWEAVTITMALIMSALLQARDARWDWQQEQWQTERNAERSRFRRIESGLSKREWEILHLLADASLSYKQIGERLSCSESTVKTHVRHIGEKLGVSGRKEIVARADERELLSNGIEAGNADDAFSPMDEEKSPSG